MIFLICSMALRTLDLKASQANNCDATAYARGKRALLKAVWARFPWCDRKARYALAVTHLRYYGPVHVLLDYRR